jgi:hypothetical protein
MPAFPELLRTCCRSRPCPCLCIWQSTYRRGSRCQSWGQGTDRSPPHWCRRSRSYPWRSASVRRATRRQCVEPRVGITLFSEQVEARNRTRLMTSVACHRVEASDESRLALELLRSIKREVAKCLCWLGEKVAEQRHRRPGTDPVRLAPRWTAPILPSAGRLISVNDVSDATGAELDSLAGLVKSHLHVSLVRILREP